MTREERLYTMTGTILIEVAAKSGLKITTNDLKKGKASVIKRILEAEAKAPKTTESIEEPKAAETKPTEIAVEAPKTQNKAVSETPKQNIKAEPKKSNMRLTELTYKGQTKSIRAWAEEIGMPWPTLYDRVNRNGWSVEEAIEIPCGQRRKK